MDSLHQITIKVPPKKVYDAWTTTEGLKSWWTKSCKAVNKIGGVNRYNFDDGSVSFHFRIEEQNPGDSFKWLGVNGENMPIEWIGTIIEVSLTDNDDQTTTMNFGHKNWKSKDGMFTVCNTTWGELMYRLRDYCEGKGRGPLFDG